MKVRLFTVLVALILISVSVVLIYQRKNREHLLFNEGNALSISQENELDSLIERNIDDIAKNIASPVEIVSSLKNFDYDYHHDLLLKTKLSKYVTSYEKAIALGGFGVDLMYVNFYEKSADMLVTINNVRKLSQDLYLSQFFDYTMLKNLTSNTITESSIDSIIFITTYNLNQIEGYLMSSERIEIGIHMVLGAWTEGIHLLSKHALKYNDEKINEKLAEQRFFINELSKLLEVYTDNVKIKKVISELEKLKELLMNLTVEYRDIGEPWKTVDIDGNDAWYQWQESIMHIDSVQVVSISNEVEIFRNLIFKL